MLRKKKKCFLLLILLIVIFCSGCKEYVFNVKTLLSPPEISNEYESIKIFLNKNFEEYSIILPEEGTDKKGIYLVNLDSDNKKESVVLLKNNNEEQFYILILEKNDENKWIIGKKIASSEEQIKSINFIDITGDKIKEIILGFSGNSNNSNNLFVYSKFENYYKEIFSKKYTEYILGDIDEDKRPELLLITLNKIDGGASAKLYDYDSNINLMYLVDKVQLDGYVNNYYSVSFGSVSEDTKGFLLDVSVGAHSSYTDLIIMREGRLKNVFYDEQWEFTDITFRPYQSEVWDSDKDGIIEIPLLRIPKGYDEKLLAEVPFITVWMQWNGLDGLVYDFESYINEVDNFMISFPKDWRNHVTLAIDSNEYLFQYYSILEKKMYNLFEIKILDKEYYNENQRKYFDYYVLNQKINKVFLLKINKNINERFNYIDLDFIKSRIEYID